MSTNGEYTTTVNTVEDDGTIEVYVKFSPPGQFSLVAPKTDLQTTLAILLEVVKANIMAMKQEQPRVTIPGMDIQKRIV